MLDRDRHTTVAVQWRTDDKVKTDSREEAGVPFVMAHVFIYHARGALTGVAVCKQYLHGRNFSNDTDGFVPRKTNTRSAY